MEKKLKIVCKSTPSIFKLLIHKPRKVQQEQITSAHKIGHSRVVPSVELTVVVTQDSVLWLASTARSVLAQVVFQ
jgi:hypothetical protein